MARLLTIGFEVGVPVSNVASPDHPSGLVTSGSFTLARDTSHQRTGNGCFALTTATGASAYFTLLTPALSTTYFIRAYFNFATLPTGSAFLVSPSGGTVGVSVRITPGGKLQLWNNVAGTQIGSDSAATIVTGTYYRIELQIVLNASTQITSGELRLDGVTVATFSGLTLASAAILAGWETPGDASSKILYMDDVAVNTSAGAVNNTWPGDGKVVMLLPISDNAVGAGWTLGNGTAISANGWDSVNNEPPVGIADLGGAGADTGQIRNAGSNANANYDANLTDYTTAGVGASDTINAVTPWVATAAPVATSAKLGTVGVVSNPAIANVNLGAGGTAQAFWSGVAAGAYPTGWKWSPGTITEAPTVTKGTSPVARITQVTASTRIADVCFLGMYVDYTPAVAAPKSLVEAGSRGMRSRAVPHLMIR